MELKITDCTLKDEGKAVGALPAGIAIPDEGITLAELQQQICTEMRKTAMLETKDPEANRALRHFNDYLDENAVMKREP